VSTWLGRRYDRRPSRGPALVAVAASAVGYALLTTTTSYALLIGIVRAGIERMRQLLEHIWKLAADGSAWEAELARRGLLDEGALEIAWVEQHAEALVES
jgi:hypothetical protein